MAQGFPEDLMGAMIFLASRIPESVNWAVAGSSTIALQGVDVTPHDMDILTDSDGTYKIADALKGYAQERIEYGSTDKYRSHSGVFLIGGVKVEIMGDLQVFRNGKWADVQNPEKSGIETVSINTTLIPVVPLTHLRKTGYFEERIARKEKEDHGFDGSG